MEKRPNYLDYSKAIGIWIVVFGHYAHYLRIPFANSLLWNNAYNVTLFHMPLFFIVTGMLYKIRTVKEELRKNIRSLLIPYLLINVICLIVYSLMEDISGRQLLYNIAGILSGSDFHGTGAVSAGPLWFVFSLFCIKIVVSCWIYLMNINKWGGVFLLFSLFLIIGITVFKGDVFPFRIDSSSIGLLFFIIGFKGKEFFEKSVNQKVKYLLLIGGLSLIVLILSACFNINYGTMGGALSINACRWGRSFILFVVGAISGTIFIFFVCRFFSKFKNNIIMKLSNGTIIILGFHQLFYLFFQNTVTSENFFFAVVFSLFILFMCYILIVLSAKYFPILLGGRILK